MYILCECILLELFYFFHSKFDIDLLTELMTVFSVLPVLQY